MVTIVIFFVLFLISDAEKISTLDGLTKILSIIISVSLGALLINNLAFNLPFEYLQYDSGKGDGGKVIFKNYYLFIQPVGYSSVRFYSIFDEPGTLGTLLAFVLFANSYSMKNKNNIVLLVGGVLTFSLAFFILTLIGYIVINAKSVLATIKAAVVVMALFIAIIFFLEDSEGFKAIVIDRVLNLDENGVDSRTTTSLSMFFNDFLYSFDILLGMGTSFFKENPELFSGQNYKLFIVEYGLFGFLLMVLMYLSMAARNLKVGFFCLLIFLVSFLQRPFMFTPWQTILFSLTFTSLHLHLYQHKKTSRISKNYNPSPRSI